MLSDLNKPQRVLMYILFGLTGFALIVGIFVCYQLMLVAKPRTLGVSYANTLTTSSGEVPICEVEIWENANKNGLEAYGVRWNSYTDADGSWVKGFGLQVIGSNYGAISSSGEILPGKDSSILNGAMSVFESKTLSSRDLSILKDSNYFFCNSTIVYGDWYGYQSDDNGATSYILDKDDLNDNLYIDIDGKYYQIVLNNYKYKTSHRKWYGKEYTKTHTSQYSWFDLATYIINSAKNNSAKTEYSTYYIDLLDCAEYYHLLYQDEKGQYHELSKVSDLRNYLQIKITYHADGLVNANDSMFKQVKNNPNWSYYDNSEVEDFWSVMSLIDITEQHIQHIQDESSGKIYLTIDKTFAQYLSSLSNAEIKVNINLDNLGYTTSGILMDNFIFKVKEFNINSSTNQNFTILNQTNIAPTLSFGGDING